MRAHPLALPVVLAALTACAPGAGGDMTGADPSPARQCFSIDQVRDFQQGQADQLFLRVGRDEVYELNTVGGCSGLDFSPLSLGLVPYRGATGSFLCTGDWARIVTPDALSPTSVCRARINRRLTPEEVAALPTAQRP